MYRATTIGHNSRPNDAPGDSRGIGQMVGIPAVVDTIGRPLAGVSVNQWGRILAAIGWGLDRAGLTSTAECPDLLARSRRGSKRPPGSPALSELEPRSISSPAQGGLSFLQQLSQCKGCDNEAGVDGFGREPNCPWCRTFLALNQSTASPAHILRYSHVLFAGWKLLP